MILYVGLTRPVDKETEDRIEECILNWFYKYKRKMHLIGVFPYDPVTMEFAIDIGEQPHEILAESLRRRLERLELKDTETIVSDRSIVEGLPFDERVSHVKRKLRFLCDRIRRITQRAADPRLQQIEYLLNGVSAEVAYLFQTETSFTVPPPPVEDSISKQIDEFWENL